MTAAGTTTLQVGTPTAPGATARVAGWEENAVGATMIGGPIVACALAGAGIQYLRRRNDPTRAKVWKGAAVGAGVGVGAEILAVVAFFSLWDVVRKW